MFDRYRQIDPVTDQVVYEPMADIEAIVVIKKWPQDPFDAGQFNEGTDVTITVPLQLYPEPNDIDFKWIIIDEYENQNELVPGTN